LQKTIQDLESRVGVMQKASMDHADELSTLKREYSTQLSTLLGRLAIKDDALSLLRDFSDSSRKENAKLHQQVSGRWSSLIILFGIMVTLLLGAFGFDVYRGINFIDKVNQVDFKVHQVEDTDRRLRLGAQNYSALLTRIAHAEALTMRGQVEQ